MQVMLSCGCDQYATYPPEDWRIHRPALKIQWHIDKPLLFEGGLENGTTFVTVSDRVDNLLLAFEEALMFEILEDFFATFFGSETKIRLWNILHFALIINNTDAL